MTEQPILLRDTTVDYTPAAVRAHRDHLLVLRDEALRQQAFEHAVVLYHVAAYLAELAALLEGSRVAIAALPEPRPYQPPTQAKLLDSNAVERTSWQPVETAEDPDRGIRRFASFTHRGHADSVLTASAIRVRYPDGFMRDLACQTTILRSGDAVEVTISPDPFA